MVKRLIEGKRVEHWQLITKKHQQNKGKGQGQIVDFVVNHQLFAFAYLRIGYQAEF